jgi:hypothetical protein
LVKLGESANPLYNSIRNQFFFRLAGSAFEEMVSVPDAADRLAQLDGCRRLTGQSVSALAMRELRTCGRGQRFAGAEPVYQDWRQSS